MAGGKKVAAQSGQRLYRTDYAGAWNGHCKTRESAIQAAVRHCLYDGYSHCVITGPTGQVARVSYDYATKRITVQAEKFLHRPTKQSK